MICRPPSGHVDEFLGFDRLKWSGRVLEVLSFSSDMPVSFAIYDTEVCDFTYMATAPELEAWQFLSPAKSVATEPR